MDDVKIIYQVLTDRGLTTVLGEGIRLPYTDASFGIHARYDVLGRFHGWHITHLLSGMPISAGKTRRDAFLKAVEHVREHQHEIQSVLASAVRRRAQLDLTQCFIDGG
ncbi:hypothetical protein [Pandoraea pnomenusa]|uniref:hypothetical protein n=1 Tax=Pandoraea pnomenusa TaxID=93220 RepID=UPI00333F6C44